MDKPTDDDPGHVPAIFKMMAPPGAKMTERARRILGEGKTTEPKPPTPKKQGELPF